MADSITLSPFDREGKAGIRMSKIPWNHVSDPVEVIICQEGPRRTQRADRNDLRDDQLTYLVDGVRLRKVVKRYLSANSSRLQAFGTGALGDEEAAEVTVATDLQGQKSTQRGESGQMANQGATRESRDAEAEAEAEAETTTPLGATFGRNPAYFSVRPAIAFQASIFSVPLHPRRSFPIAVGRP